MRLLVATLFCLLTAIAAAPGAEASCHFCLDETVAACTGADGAACKDNATYMAKHYPAHVLETACSTVDC